MAGVRLTLFVSSTVQDFASVREQLRRHFSKRHFNVLLSEHPSFPVGRGADILEICLSNVRQADAYVLLIGQRFGAEHEGTTKSITWLEWEEALRCGLDPIVLIEKSANDAVGELREARLRLDVMSLGLSEIDVDLALSQQFSDQGRRERLIDVERFIHEVKSSDRWLHLEWDGRGKSAIELIELRLGDLFAGYRAVGRELRTERLRLAGLATVVNAAGVLMNEVHAGTVTPPAAALVLLQRIAMERSALFQFTADDRFSLGLHRRKGTAAVPDPTVRVAAGGVLHRGRTRKKGQSHVTLAMDENGIVVGEDIRLGSDWYVDPDPKVAAEDRQNYVSVISVPLLLRSAPKNPRGKPNAALTMTSGRARHFRSSPEEPVRLTFEILSRIVSEVLDAGQGAPP